MPTRLTESKAADACVAKLLDPTSQVHTLIEQAIQFYARDENSISLKLKAIYLEFTNNIPDNILLREGQHAINAKGAKSNWKYDRFLCKLHRKIDAALDANTPAMEEFRHRGDAALFAAAEVKARSQASKDLKTRYGTRCGSLVLAC